MRQPFFSPLTYSGRCRLSLPFGRRLGRVLHETGVAPRRLVSTIAGDVSALIARENGRNRPDEARPACRSEIANGYENCLAMSLPAQLLRLSLRYLVARAGTAEPQIDVLRRRMERVLWITPGPPRGTQTRRLDANGVKAVCVATPQSLPGRHVLYLHGGGYVMASPANYRRFPLAHRPGRGGARRLPLLSSCARAPVSGRAG